MLILFAESVTLITRLLINRLCVCVMVSDGKADRNTAIAPATCGEAWDVPLSMMPAAEILTPGANIVK